MINLKIVSWILTGNAFSYDLSNRNKQSFHNSSNGKYRSVIGFRSNWFFELRFTILTWDLLRFDHNIIVIERLLYNNMLLSSFVSTFSYAGNSAILLETDTYILYLGGRLWWWTRKFYITKKVEHFETSYAIRITMV